MKRRDVIKATGALAALGLAGCTGDGDDGTDTTTGSPAAGTSPPGTDTPTDVHTDTRAPPLVQGSSITTVSTSCRSDGDQGADVSFQSGPSTVTITGTLHTGDPCHEATIAGVSYDKGSDTLAVQIDAQSTDEACTQCLGAIEYEATVEFMDQLPGTVEVTHAGTVVTRTDKGTPTPSPGPAPDTSVASTEFTIENVGGSGGSEVTDISFDEDANTVTVTGTIVGRDGCKTAALGSVNYDAGADALSVDIVTKNREDSGDVCTEALVYFEYTATVSFDGGLPGSATVSHNGEDRASASYATARAAAPTSTTQG